MRIELICVGTELLSAKTNTHVTYLGDKLQSIGLIIAREHTVPDDPHLMKEAFAESWQRSDLVICCGGLGPTFDDITRDVWSRVTERRLILQKDLVSLIRDRFRRRGVVMPPQNKRQGQVFKGAEVLPNDNGTAPGQWLEVGRKVLILLPGPAREHTPMFERYVLPKLKSRFLKTVFIQKSFHVAGIPESVIDAQIRPLIQRHPTSHGCQVTYGILASQNVVSVKFTVEGHDSQRIQKAFQSLTLLFRQRLGHQPFAEDNRTLPQVVGEMLRRKRRTLGLAESCTGGLVSKLITDEPGASDYLLESLVTYANKSIVNRLGVKVTTLKKFGAVSAPVAKEMAIGLQKTAGVDFALSITGVAGPAGATPDKPLGLIFICCAGPKRVHVERFHLLGDRGAIRQRAAVLALEILRKELQLH